MSDARGNGPNRGRMPVIFAGHGSPINAVEDNRWSRGFASLRDLVPEPKAILVISAHWFVDGTLVTANTEPRTIHDFSGFPQVLYEIEYSAQGNPDLARHVRRLLGEDRSALDSDWGLDHGTWSVLRRMYPEANIPVIQLSIDRNVNVRGHFEIARSLAELRDEGVLILCSGNAVHNLRDAFSRMRAGYWQTPEWAQRYDETVKEVLRQRDTRTLISMWPDTSDGRLAHPTPDHWLPLVYAYGATDSDDHVRFSSEGFDWGSLSMRNAVFG